MRSLALIIIFFIVVFEGNGQVIPSFGNSRTGTTGMQFLKVAPDSKGASLAGAYTALADDPSACYWNPAGITRKDTSKVNITINQTTYFSGTSAAFVSAIFKGKKQTFFGLSVFSVLYGKINETTEFQPIGTGRTLNFANYTISGTYARQLTDNFSFGVNMKFAQEGFAGVTTNNVLFDLGLRYDIGIKNARFAVGISNYGLNVKPGGSVSVLKYTGTEQINQFQSVSVPAIFRLGAAFSPIQKGNHLLTTSVQLNHPTDNNETFSIGAEYGYKKILFARTGYEFGQDEKGFPPVGFGLNLIRRFGWLRIDYAWCNKSRLGNSHRIGVTASFR